MKTNMMKMGMTLTLIAALGATSVVAFADTAATSITSVGSNIMNKFGGNSLVDRLVKDGVITQAQVDKYQDQMRQERTDAMKTAIAQLVKDGKLTQAKADAFLKAVEAHHAERDALKAKLDAMTEADRQAYLKTLDLRGNDPVQALVTKGVLTTADLDAIHAVLGGKGSMGGPGGMGHGKGHGGMGFKRGMGGPVAPNNTGSGL